MAHTDGPAGAVEVALRKRECLADATTGSPQQDDESVRAKAVQGVAGATHDGDDLFDRRRVGRIAPALVAGRAAGPIARQSGGRATPTGGVEHHENSHRRSLRRLHRHRQSIAHIRWQAKGAARCQRRSDADVPRLMESQHSLRLFEQAARRYGPGGWEPAR